MKILKTRKRIYAALSVIILITGISFLQSCSNDDSETTIRPELEKRIKVISKSDIPKGVIPLVLNSREELYALIEKMDSIKVLGSVVDHTKKNQRIKSRAPEVGQIPLSAEVYGPNYVISITISYNLENHSAAVSSESSTTWYFSSWTQTSGQAAFNGNKIDYALTGDLKWYAIVSLQWIEINKKIIPVSGNTQY